MDNTDIANSASSVTAQPISDEDHSAGRSASFPRCLNRLTFDYNLQTMTTTIEKEDLCTELQELYLKSKEWISALDFQADDITFLKKLFSLNSPLLAKHGEINVIADVFIKAVRIEDNQLRIKRNINSFMDELAALVKKTDPAIDPLLLQTYSGLENDLSKNLDEYKNFKTSVFRYASDPVLED